MANLVQACLRLAGAFGLSSIMLDLRQPPQDLIFAYSPTFTVVPRPGGYYLAPEEAGYSPLRLNSSSQPQQGTCQFGAVGATTVPEVIHRRAVYVMRHIGTHAILFHIYFVPSRLRIAPSYEIFAHLLLLMRTAHRYQPPSRSAPRIVTAPTSPYTVQQMERASSCDTAVSSSICPWYSACRIQPPDSEGTL